MLGVSQPSNPPSSLRHSASFSCLQRSSNGENGHRARTSTLPQQPNVQLPVSTSHHHHHHHHHYGGPSSLQQQQQQQQQTSSSRRNDADGESVDQSVTENSGNDYGFVRIRPRLRSTNSSAVREDTENRTWQQKTLCNERETSSSSRFGGSETTGKSKQESESCEIEASSHRSTSGARDIRDTSKNVNHQTGNQNPLRGALILFTASTSSWWKAKQREDLGTSSIASSSSSSGTTERKWSNVGGPSNAMTPPSSSNGLGNDRKWVSHNQHSQHHSIANITNNSSSSERKWSSKTGTLVACSSTVGGNNVVTKDDKWTSISAASSSPSSTGQDRKWRSLGALLRTPNASSGPVNLPNSQQNSRNIENPSFAHNMSVSMIENVVTGKIFENSGECATVGPAWKSVRYPANGQPTSYSAGRPSWSEKDSSVLREIGEFARPARTGKVSRRLYQESTEESPDSRTETWEDRRIGKTRGESSGDETTSWKKKTTSGNVRECCQRSERQANGAGPREISTRSSRAQSFYLLDDFLRPQQQQQQQSQSSSKCNLDLSLPSQYQRNGGSQERSVRSSELSIKNCNTSGKHSHQQTSSSLACNVNQQQRSNLTNITPPRRHNSSSDSLEVATSPLPPPVPPPPPPEIGSNGEKDRVNTGDRQNSYRDKDIAVGSVGGNATGATNSATSVSVPSASSCHCRMCWTSLQQRSFRDEVSWRSKERGSIREDTGRVSLIIALESSEL